MAESKVGLSINDKVALIGNLSTMLKAGIPILDAVDSLAEDVKGNQKKILDALKADLTQGKRIYTTLSRFPRAFDPVTVNIIKAAEEAGNLDIALNDIRINIVKEAEFSGKIKSALVYPAFILLVFGGVLGLILFFVMPRIAQVFSRIKVDLPLPTRILIFVSDLLTTKGVYIGAGFVVLAILLLILYRAQKKLVLGALFSLPLITDVIYKMDLTRLSRSLFLLLGSGIPITHALELVQDVTIKRETGEMIKRSREMVLNGKSFSAGLRTSKRVPRIMIKLVEAGEKTGTLDKSLEEVSEHFDYEVTNNLKTLVALFEPMMLVIIGISVGGLMISIIGPIYGLIGQVGGN